MFTTGLLPIGLLQTWYCYNLLSIDQAVSIYSSNGRLSFYSHQLSGASMEFRTIAIYLLVCALLFCPYPCLSHIVNVCCETPGKDRDCEERDNCCPTTSAEPCQKSPGNSDCCTRNGTCLCHGAILEHFQAPADFQSELEVILPLDMLLTLRDSFVVDNICFNERATCHFPLVESGRKVRALIESFLI
jgi:hypothetical protein